jgi:hypothetical protein
MGARVRSLRPDRPVEGIYPDDERRSLAIANRTDCSFYRRCTASTIIAAALAKVRHGYGTRTTVIRVHPTEQKEAVDISTAQHH